MMEFDRNMLGRAKRRSILSTGCYTLWRETVRLRPVTLTVGRGEVPARAAR
jgi:hypothetical protein